MYHGLLQEASKPTADSPKTGQPADPILYTLIATACTAIATAVKAVFKKR